MVLQPGTRVVTKGLQSAAGAALNGMEGKILGYDKEKERWEVLFDDGSMQAKLLKAANLEEVSLATATVVEVCATCGTQLDRDDTLCSVCASRAAAHAEQQRRSSVPRRRSSIDEFLRGRRASSWGPRSPQQAALQEENLEVVRLRQMLQEWQSANAQWQAAYVQIQNQCVLLESENRQLREVVEAAEGGPNMDARFIARLARQNWRLGREVGLRTSDVASDDGEEASFSEARLRKESGDVDEAEEDTGRGRRPKGVKRLPLRKKSAEDGVITQVDGEVTESSSSAGGSDAENDRLLSNADGKSVPVSTIACRRDGMDDEVATGKERPVTGLEDGRSRHMEKRRNSQRQEAERREIDAHRCQEDQSERPQSRRETDVATSAMPARVVKLAIGLLGITFTAAVTIGRFMALSEGSEAEL